MTGDARLAELLDAERAPHDSDLRYWASRTRGRVLEMGCGTGRLGALLRRQAVPYLGLDPDPAMLNRARRNAPGVPFARADLTRFAARRFGAAVSLYAGWQALPTREARARCLACAREALAPDGLILLDLENHSPRALASAPRRLAGEVAVGAERFSKFETLRRDAGVVEVKWEWYCGGKPAATLTRRLAALDRRAVEAELRFAGFELYAIFGDWHEGTYAERGARMVVEAAKV